MCAFAAVVGACSGGSSNTSASTTTTSTTGTSTAAAERSVACERLTSADASAFFGEPAVVATTNERRASAAASTCFYGTLGESGQLLQFHVYANEQYYARAELPDAQDVVGLGERAFVSRDGPGGLVSCQFARNKTVYALSYSNRTGNAPAKADALVALAREIARRVEAPHGGTVAP
jgi:hypothetical protein